MQQWKSIASLALSTKIHQDAQTATNYSIKSQVVMYGTVNSRPQSRARAFDNNTPAYTRVCETLSKTIQQEDTGR